MLLYNHWTFLNIQRKQKYLTKIKCWIFINIAYTVYDVGNILFVNKH